MWSFASPFLLPLVLLPIVHVLRIVLLRRFDQLSPQEAALAAEAADLEAKKKNLSQVQDFVQVSKIGRRLVAIDKEAKAAVEARAAARAARHVALPLAYGHYVVIAVLTLLFWGTPVAHIPAGWFLPVGWLLRLTGGPGSHLGILPWSVLISSLSWRVLFSTALRTGFLKPAPVKGWLDSFKDALKGK